MKLGFNLEYEEWKELAHSFWKPKVFTIRRFRAFFGLLSLEALVKIGNTWITKVAEKRLDLSPTHLLWGLFFLKYYPTEELVLIFAKCCEKTFRMKVRLVIGVLNLCFEVIWSKIIF